MFTPGLNIRISYIIDFYGNVIFSLLSLVFSPFTAKKINTSLALLGLKTTSILGVEIGQGRTK